jgi:hypothetical protein
MWRVNATVPSLGAATSAKRRVNDAGYKNLKTFEFIPIKSSAATGSCAPESWVALPAIHQVNAHPLGRVGREVTLSDESMEILGQITKVR